MQKKIITLTTTIPVDLAGQRLDHALAHLFPEHSRTRLQQWLKNHSITVNGNQLRAKDKVLGGEFISINAEISEQTPWNPEAISLNIIHEDDDILVVNKPIGLVTHPAVGNPNHTLVNALLHHSAQLQHLPRAGIVHRLDKDTSGLLVVAKTLPAHTYLVQQLQNRSIEREYEAIVNGVLISGGTVDAPIGRHPVQRMRMGVIEDGKPARTHYRVKERFRAYTWLRVKLETGRTHQIRVHMAHIHHPLLGDKVYGRFTIPPKTTVEVVNALKHFSHQALHASQLTLAHPESKELMTFHAPLPDDMQQILAILREDKASG